MPQPGGGGPRQRRERRAGEAESLCQSAGGHAANSRHSASRLTSPSPSGSRPSASSFSRWACMTTAAAGRSSLGTSSQTRSRRRARDRSPWSSSASSLSLAHQAVLQVLVDLGRGILDVGTMPGAEQLEVGGPQALQGVEVGGQRAAVGRNEARTVAEHQVAAEADLPQQEADVVGRVARSREDLEGAHAPRLGGDRGAGRSARGAGLAGGLVARSDLAEQERGAEHRHARRVVRVRVGEQDTGDAAAILGRRAHGLEMRLRRRARGRSRRRDWSPRRRCSCPRASSARDSARRS